MTTPAERLEAIGELREAAAKRYHIYTGPNFANVDPPHTELFKDCVSPHCTKYMEALATIPDLEEE